MKGNPPNAKKTQNQSPSPNTSRSNKQFIPSPNKNKSHTPLKFILPNQPQPLIIMNIPLANGIVQQIMIFEESNPYELAKSFVLLNLGAVQTKQEIVIKVANSIIQQMKNYDNFHKNKVSNFEFLRNTRGSECSTENEQQQILNEYEKKKLEISTKHNSDSTASQKEMQLQFGSEAESPNFMSNHYKSRFGQDIGHHQVQYSFSGQKF